MIDPARRETDSMAARLWRHRELILTLVKRDLKIRYKASSLGFFWSFGKPLLLMLVIWLVFSMFAKIPSSHPWLPYALHLLTALLPWIYLQGALSESLYSVIGNGNVVKKVWLPTEVFPASVVLGHLVHFCLAMMVLTLFIAGFAILGHVPDGEAAGARLGLLLLPSWEILLIPLLVVLQTLLIFGIALIFAALNVFYRDMASIAEIVLTAWFYLTPVIYPANYARATLRDQGHDLIYWVWLCNPMTPITLAYRRLVYGRLFGPVGEVSDTTLLAGLAVATLATFVVLFAGIRLYESTSRRFADEL